MNAAKKIEALLTVLDDAKPDLDAILEAVVIITVALRRLPRGDTPRVTVARRNGRTLMAFPQQYLLHVTMNDWMVADVRDVPPVLTATWTASGSIVVDEVDPDGEEETSIFEWGWREVADGLAAALRALPSRARAPKAVRCPFCRKEFVP